MLRSLTFLLIGLLAWPPGLQAAVKCPSRFRQFWNPIPRDIYLSKASQLALETEHGKRFLESLGFKSVDELQRFLNGNTDPTVKEFRRQLLERLAGIDATIARFRGMQVKANASLAGHTPDSDLSPEERIIAEFMAQRQLSVAADTRAMLAKETPAPKKPRFFEEVPDGNPQAITAIREKMAQGGRNHRLAMEECRKNQSPSESLLSKRAVQESAYQVGVSLTVTTLSAATVVGWDHLDDLRMTDLSLMLLLTALNSGLGTLYLNGNGTAMQRYWKAMALFQGINVLNTGLYALAPDTGEKTETWKYGAYYMMFGATVPAASLPLNDFLMGFHCLYPDLKWTNRILEIVARSSFSATANVLFFVGEEKLLYSDKKEPK